MRERSWPVTAIILAGGRGSRLDGQDKGLLKLAGTSLVEHVITRIRPQCEHILISANRNFEAYQSLHYPVIADQFFDFQGPLAGISSALAHVDSKYIITLPCDCPLVISNYVELFLTVAADQPGRMVVAKSKTGIEPLFCLMPTTFESSLYDFLKSGQRKALQWIEQNNPLIVDFSENPKALWMFQNINTQEDLDFLEQVYHEPS